MNYPGGGNPRSSTTPVLTGPWLLALSSWLKQNLECIVKLPICHRDPSLCSGFQNQLVINSLALIVVLITAFIRATRKPPFSNSIRPSMVQPAGVVTASLSSAG